ncbi:MAG: tryptophan synthase alpha chain [bacterium]
MQTSLEQAIKQGKKKKDILLMTHIVLGYPSFADNFAVVEAMAKAGVEFIELQIPFSEPSADGPTIVQANQESLINGTKVQDCFEFAGEIAKKYPKISFLFMTYYNILYAHGIEGFIKRTKALGLKALIVPDLPFEEADDYLEECKKEKIDPIFIFTPTHKTSRMSAIAKVASGFVYCVGRKGVTGVKTEFDEEISEQIRLYRSSTQLPIALGFGVQSKEDVDFLKGKVDIAVIGSKLLRIQEEKGNEAVGTFLASVR